VGWVYLGRECVTQKFDFEPHWGYNDTIDEWQLQTVVEMPEFIRQIRSYLNDNQVTAFIY
jgi:hypothetical protein